MSDLMASQPPAYPTPGMALAAAPPTPRRFDWPRILLLSGVITFFAVCGLAVLAYVGWRIGPVALGETAPTLTDQPSPETGQSVAKTGAWRS